MSEKALLTEIGRIARVSQTLSQALIEAEALFASKLGHVRFLVRAAGASVFQEPAVGDFLESHSFPFRGVYTTPLGAGGVLIMCVGSWGTPDHAIEGLVSNVALQLSPLAASAQQRTRRDEAA